MLVADELPDEDTRHGTIVEASGISGKSTTRTPMFVYLALRAYATDRALNPRETLGEDVVSYVARKLRWDADHNVQPDSIRRRIERAIAKMAPTAAAESRVLLQEGRRVRTTARMPKS